MWSLFRRNGQFRRLFCAQLVSYAGDWFATVAAIGLLLDHTGSDLLASLFWVAQSLPTFVMAPIAGPVVDRFDRRTVLVVASFAQAAVALLFLLAGAGLPWMVFVAQGGVTALGSFFGPASQAAVANLVDEEDLPNATAMMSATWGAMLAVGAALGAGVTVLFGREVAFLVDAGSFVLAGALVLSIRTPMQAERDPEAIVERMRPLRDTAEALRYARRHPSILALLGSHVGFALGAGVVGMLAVLSDERWQAGDGGTGLLLTARGIGVLLGPLVIRNLVQKGIRGVLLACGAACIGYGVFYLGVALSPWIVLAFVLVLLAHLGGGAQWTLTTYGIQTLTPDALRGRVFAAAFALVTLAMSISLVIAGVLGGLIGPGWTVAAIASVNVLWGIGFLVVTRGIRGEAEEEARLVSQAHTTVHQLSVDATEEVAVEGVRPNT
jgi:MFS family permease